MKFGLSRVVSRVRCGPDSKEAKRHQASTNGGGSWSAVRTGLTNTYVGALAIDPTTCGSPLSQVRPRTFGSFASRGRKRDGGGFSEAGMQVQASNHLKLLWSNAMVVSVEEKAYEIRQVWIREVSDKRTNVSVEQCLRRCQNWGLALTPRTAWEIPAYCLSGIRRTVGTNLVWALL